MANLSDADALLAAVWASPHDDLPRLVYADFIEERGAPGDADRAEFIRLQIAREAAEAVGDDVADEQHWREEALFEANKRAWLAGSGELTDIGIASAKRDYCVRGFPAPAFYHAGQYDSRWGHPVRVNIYGFESANELAACLRTPLARGAQILGLGVHRPLWPQDFVALAAVNSLDCLRELELDDVDGGPADLDWLSSLGPPGLHRLQLSSWSPNREVVAALAGSPCAGRLTHLAIGLGRASGLCSLPASAFPRLRTLCPWSVPPAELPSLVTMPLAARLRELTLPAIRGIEAFYLAVAAAPPPALKVLRLPFRPPLLSAEVVRLICRAPHLVANLRELHAPPDDRVAGMLREAFGHRLRPLRSWARVRAGGG